ncbi:MAG: DUF1801 domain-containing protein [Anaerolineae bacterium]|nr:DUF1801 domain-containing protein [Anaerolineae bacterium]
MKKSSKSENVDSYIADQVEAARPILEELRKIINSTIPEAEETISWGYPFFRYHGILAGITAYKKHVSFQIADSLQDKDRQTLEEAGYTLGEKRIQIKFDQQVPATVIKQMLKTQAKMNEAKAK